MSRMTASVQSMTGPSIDWLADEQRAACLRRRAGEQHSYRTRLSSQDARSRIAELQGGLHVTLGMRGGIADLSVVDDGEFRDAVLGDAAVENVLNSHAAGGEGVADERAMAAPGNGLGT